MLKIKENGDIILEGTDYYYNLRHTDIVGYSYEKSGYDYIIEIITIYGVIKTSIYVHCLSDYNEFQETLEHLKLCSIERTKNMFG